MSVAIFQPKNFALPFTKKAASEKKTASVSKSLTEKINIFLTIDQATIGDHFNLNDPAPLYKRQLSHQFQQYIATSIESAKRHSVFYYKVTLRNESDRQYIEPFMYAIKRHFSAKKVLKIAEFEKFKRRSYMLLILSLVVVMICRGIVPMILDQDHHIQGGLTNSLDIFSWVLLWQPIDKLLFHYNPFLKEICIIDKLANAEVIITQNA